MKDISHQTLASLVSVNHRVVPVLEKYNLDFCYSGKRNLAEGCIEKGLKLEEVTQELKSVMAPITNKSMPFTEMSPGQLISHILVTHHFYLKQAMPQIHLHLEKVAVKHGDRFPFMVEVFELFKEIELEMIEHMKKEETVLFPMIRNMERLGAQSNDMALPNPTIFAGIHVMEKEHEKSGVIMHKIRSLTNHYSTTEGACTTFRTSLHELKEFEDDFNEHVYLENHILFPKAKLLVA